MLRTRVCSVASALLLLAGCGKSREAAAPQVGRYDRAPVILISIDTLRADRLPAYGYRGVSTPNIDRLRADGILFRDAYSHVPLTLPSHVTMLTGLYPGDSGVRDNIGYRVSLPASGSLPTALATRGYASGAAVSAFVLRGNTGIASLFQSYDDRIAFAPGAELGDVQRPGSETIAQAQAWIDAQKAQPFFAFVHLFEPHAPYDPPAEFRAKGADAYDGEIAYVDALVGGFLDHLRKSGLYDRAIIVLVSDHGEGLGDHGEREHGLLLYREAIHVPLIIKLPRQEGSGGEVTTPAGLVDLFPTLVSLTGGAAPAGIDGRVILGPDARPASDRTIFSETMYGRLHYGWSELRSMTGEKYHYIDAPRPELYDHVADPAEKSDVLSDNRRVAAAFRASLEPLRKPLNAPGAASPEEMKKLASLGYLTTQTAPGGGNVDPKDGIAQLSEFERANDLLAAGDSAGAERVLRSLLASNPRFTDASIALARALEQQRRFDEAATTYRSLLASNPALTEQVAIGIATSYLNAGKLDDARKHAELALHSNPGGAHLLLGRIALAAGDAAAAEREARAAGELKQYAAEAALLRVDALVAARKLDEALRAIDSAVAAGVTTPGLLTAKGSVLVRMNRPAEAEQAWRAEVAAHPRQREAWGRLAAMSLLRNDAAAAERDLETMVAADPSPASYALAANTMRHFGQAAAAERWARRGAEAGRMTR